MSVVVEVVNRQQAVRVDAAWLGRIARQAVAALDCDTAEITVVVVDNRQIARLHDRWLGIPGPTDVLTFDLAEDGAASLAGDIVVSVETAKQVARELGWQARHELAYYVVHGLLHLTGFDDGTPGERRKMRRKERAVMAAIGLPAPPRRPRFPPAMPADKTLALVIRTFPFGETSSVVALFCREFGKLRALAKGAWRPKSSFDGGLDLLSMSQVLVLRKSSGGLDLLTEASLESRFRVGTSLAAVLGGLHVAELLDVLTADADPQPELFDVAHATLRRLSDWRGDESSLAGILLSTELAILRIVGHAPETSLCVECRGPLPSSGRTAFGMLEGGTLCPECRRGRRAVASLSAPALAALGGRGEPPPAAATEARAVITSYLAHLLGRPTRVAARLRAAPRRRTN